MLRDRRVGQLLRGAAGGRDAGGGRVAIVGYRDRVVEPVPKAEGTDYRADKLGPPFTGPATAPGVVVQPEGRGFHIDGRVVRYSVTSTAVHDRITVDEWTEPTPFVIYMSLLYYYYCFSMEHATVASFNSKGICKLQRDTKASSLTALIFMSTFLFIIEVLAFMSLFCTI